MNRKNFLRPISFALVACSILFGACVKTNVTTMDSQQAMGGGTVQVFYTPPADREYTEIGLVTTQTGQTIFHDRSAQGMIEKLKSEAAKVGADAIIVREANEGTWGLKGGGNTGFERGNAQAVAIKFK